MWGFVYTSLLTGIMSSLSPDPELTFMLFKVFRLKHMMCPKNNNTGHSYKSNMQKQNFANVLLLKNLLSRPTVIYPMICLFHVKFKADGKTS